jgi:hypothetical protein
MHFEVFFDTATNAAAYANGFNHELDSPSMATGSSSTFLGVPSIVALSHGRRWTGSAWLTLNVATFGVKEKYDERIARTNFGSSGLRRGNQ